MTEADKKREEILNFLLAWDAEQVAVNARPEKEPDDVNPVLRALQFFPVITLH
jgi:hypothetical protein